MTSERGTLVVVWTGDPDDKALTLAVRQMLDLDRHYPGEVFMFNVIAESAGMPNATTRETLRRLFEQMRGKLVAAALSLEHRGIMQNLSRAIISTLVTVTRQPFPLKVFGERDAAMAWLSRHDGAPSPRKLAELVNELLSQQAALGRRRSE